MNEERLSLKLQSFSVKHTLCMKVRCVGLDVAHLIQLSHPTLKDSND